LALDAVRTKDSIDELKRGFCGALQMSPRFRTIVDWGVGKLPRARNLTREKRSCAVESDEGHSRSWP